MIVDGHADIAWNVLALGRNVLDSARETRRRERGTPNVKRNGRSMLGLPDWLEGGVAVVIGSIYLSPARRDRPQPWNSQIYGDAEEAHRLGMAQVDVYHRLADQSEQITLIDGPQDLEDVLASWATETPQVGIVMALEGADPIRRPAEAEEWVQRGVRAASLSWMARSRYAGGNAQPGPLTDAGRALLEVMADFGMLLDVSHLAEEAFWEAIERYEGPVAATHANPRTFVPGPRQLSDRMIQALAERDGVMGIVPYNRFLKPGWSRSDGKAAVTVHDVAAAIDHACQVVGDAAHVGLGSDFDGGFGADATPAEIETVADLPRIGDALAERGFDADHIAAVMGENWLRVLRRTLEG
jgi:membrane dipeptidase